MRLAMKHEVFRFLLQPCSLSFIVLVTSCEKLQSEDEFIPLRFAGCLL